MMVSRKCPVFFVPRNAPVVNLVDGSLSFVDKGNAT